MKELTDLFEIEKYKEELAENRKLEQKERNDFDYDEYGNIEKCEDCGSPLNSHSHCPQCDY